MIGPFYRIMIFSLLLLTIPLDHGEVTSPWFYVNITLAILFIAEVVYLLLKKTKPILEDESADDDIA